MEIPAYGGVRDVARSEQRYMHRKNVFGYLPGTC